MIDHHDVDVLVVSRVVALIATKIRYNLQLQGALKVKVNNAGSGGGQHQRWLKRLGFYYKFQSIHD